MNVLTFTTLYPNAIQQRHGIFIETRIRHLYEHGNTTGQVVAPVPWFPFKNDQFGQYAQFAKVPAKEQRQGIDISHPKYIQIPKIGMTIAPLMLAIASYQHLKKVNKETPFDVIDAHYFYPDGVAAVLLGKWLNKPVVITARGSDVSMIPNYWLPKRMIQWAANKAHGIITVCQALKDALLELDVNADKITVLRNGVDLDLFKPSEDRELLREQLGLSKKLLFSVGNLVELKGHHLVIEALKDLSEYHLLIAGAGPEKSRLEQLVQEHNLQGQVSFLGVINQLELQKYYSAADALILASSREGWANVLLESMACGTPVIATKVWGTPEVVVKPEAGILIERSVKGVAQGVQDLFNHYPNRTETRRYAELFNWDDTSKGQEKIFAKVIANA